MDGVGWIGGGDGMDGRLISRAASALMAEAPVGLHSQGALAFGIHDCHSVVAKEQICACGTFAGRYGGIMANTMRPQFVVQFEAF